MPAFENLSGLKFNRLTAVERAYPASNSTNKRGTSWRCICECGNEKNVNASKLKTGRTKSCGCFNDECKRARATHRMKKSPEYGAWSGMKARCMYPGDKRYEYYGGRGIRIHEPWITSFADFYSHLGPRPTNKHSLDRIDVNGHYEPGNVRWATALVQSANRRCVAHFTKDGETKTVRQWALHLGLCYKNVHAKMRRGRSILSALGLDSH